MAEIKVNAGENLQTAINNAQPGDTIVVEAGAEYVGTFSLPVKSGTSYVTIRSSALASLLEGVRVTPLSARFMARIRTNSPNGPAFFTSGAAHHYRFQGLEITTTTGVSSDGGIVRIGSNPRETSLSQITNNFDIDRCWIHGQPTQNVQQGIVLEAQDATVQHSYVSDIHYIGTDAQAILSITSPGGLRIINNYLEASGENLLIGGADPKIANLVPGMTGGIEIRRNDFFKPLTWKVGHPTYAGIHWAIKNSLELKNAKNVVIDGNVFENCWTDGQQGIPILFTARNQEGTAPWSVVDNVVFTNNTVKNTEGGVHILRTDAESKGAITSNIVIANNLFDKITSSYLVIINNPSGVTVIHNTVFKSSNIASLDSRAEDPKGTGFVIKDNLFSEGNYGVHGSGVGEGLSGMTKFYSSFVFEQNNVAGRAASLYSPANTFIATAQIGFVDPAVGNYRLAASSPLKGKASDGKDVGADIDVLLAAQGGTTPVPTPTPTPTQEPVPTPTPTPIPIPTPSPVPSPDGAKGATITDAQGNVWTLGAQKQTLRNGVHVGGGFGTIYKWLGGTVYVLGMDSFWYKWSGTKWSRASKQEPESARVLPWPSQQSQQNTLLDQQWADGFRLKRTDGLEATFVSVQS